VFGAAFCYFNVKYCGLRKKTKLKLWPITEVAVMAIATGIFGYPNEFARLDCVVFLCLL
jgi:hypothetical protein